MESSSCGVHGARHRRGATGWRLVALSLGGAFAALMPRAAHAYAVGTSGVWHNRPAVLGNLELREWNPAAGRVGDMGDGLFFEVRNPPAAAQANAAAAAANAFAPWGATGGRINLRAAGPGRLPQFIVRWDNIDAPGITSTGLVGAIPHQVPLSGIILNSGRTLRTDGWNLDTAGTRPAVIAEYDVFTVTLHEIGHGIGLDHPGNATSVMTSQDVARGAGGSWRGLERRAPFAGQPMTLGGAALPNGALAYLNPRAALAADDVLGAVTLYSGPSAETPSEAEALGGGKFRYTYRPRNLADRRSDYRFRVLEVPVPREVKVENIVVPAGWTGERTETAVRFTFSGTGGLAPGETVTFRFDADAPPADRPPTVRWAVPGVQNAARGAGGDLEDLIDDSEPLPLLNFNPLEFGVLDGTHHFLLDSFEGWRPVPLPEIDAPLPEAAPTPVPGPGAVVLLLAGLGSLALRRHLRGRRSPA